ncbi:MAG: hypothetical protein ACKPJQ_07160 [Dolichospermum sp.]
MACATLRYQTINHRQISNLICKQIPHPENPDMACATLRYQTINHRQISKLVFPLVFALQCNYEE